MFYAIVNMNKTCKVGGELTKEILKADSYDELYGKVKDFYLKNHAVGNIEVIEGKYFKTMPNEQFLIQKGDVWENHYHRVYILFAGADDVCCLTDYNEREFIPTFEFLDEYKRLGKSKVEIEDLTEIEE